MSTISTQQAEEYCLDVSRLAVELNPKLHGIPYEQTIEYLQEIINYNAAADCSHELIEVQPLWTCMEFALRDWKSVQLTPLNWVTDGLFGQNAPEKMGQLPFVSETLMRVVRPLAVALCAIASFESRAEVCSLIREAQRNAYQVKQMLEEAWDVSREAREEAP
tara:strand:+ start:83 stop:571 length:489 start_codon:yes stop_codon:yes gene_type:complete